MTVSPTIVGLAVTTVTFILALAYFTCKDREDTGCDHHHFSSSSRTGNYEAEVEIRGRRLTGGDLHVDVELSEETQRRCQHNGCNATEESRRYVDTKEVTFDV